MQTKATVVAVNGDRATVEVVRSSACEGCHKATEGEGCSVCSLMGGDRKFRAEAENPVGAKVGDRVTVESATGRVLWYSALVFGLPILATLLCYGIVGLFTEETLWKLLGAGIGFAGSFALIRMYSVRVSKSKCDIEITGILTDEDSEGQPGFREANGK